MEWISTLLFGPPSVAGSLLIYALVISLGLTLGSVRLGSFMFGSAGVMFVGLAFGHVGCQVEPNVIEFMREFGLILFVFAVGLSIGPGFLNALRSQGPLLNGVAALLVLTSVGATLGISLLARIEMPIAVGIFSGATTNTPSLAVASGTLRDQPPSAERALAAIRQASPTRLQRQQAIGSEEERVSFLRSETSRLPSLGYAVCYPGGILGSLVAIWLLRVFFRIEPDREAQEYSLRSTSQTPPLVKVGVRVTNRNLVGREVDKIPGMSGLGVTVSRLRRGDQIEVARPETKLEFDDCLLVVGEVTDVEDFRLIVGEDVAVSFEDAQHSVEAQRMIVSRKSVVGHTVDDLRLDSKFGVQVTRIIRGAIEFSAADRVPLQLGDVVMVVGTKPSLKEVVALLGDAPRSLWQPDLIPIFVGVALGILAGSLPFTIPGLGLTIRLGLAGGTLITAIVVSNFHRVGPLVWFLKPSAGFLMRDLGMALFLSSVGLLSGDSFLETLTEGDGLWWMAMGTIVTFAPLLVVSALSMKLLKIPYLTMSGVIAGGMTAPAALAFANRQADSEMQNLAYATVFPLSMILRILGAQFLIISYLQS